MWLYVCERRLELAGVYTREDRAATGYCEGGRNGLMKGADGEGKKK